jgi:hypothetical protein
VMRFRKTSATLRPYSFSRFSRSNRIRHDVKL